MPSFDFSFINKKTSKRKTSNNGVLLRNVVGVVFIDIDANYYINVDDKHYNIDKECYSCKGKSRVYAQGINAKHRICYIRNIDKCFECDPNFYLPFAPGIVVSGDIISNMNNKVFYIKKFLFDITNSKSIEALSFYRNHHVEINAIILKRRINAVK